MSDDELDVLLHRADIDGLIRLLDSLCASRRWGDVLAVRDRSRAAVQTGRQLWPIATLAEYRLALWAPPKWAATVLDDDSGRFTIGPLSEVAAQHHTFADLRPHLANDHRLGFIAHERSLRGEAIDADVIDPLDIGFVLQPWEPAYPLAEYSDDGVAQPSPERPSLAGALPVDDTPTTETVDDPGVVTAVRQLFDAWTAASHGRVEVTCVEGDAADAVHALGVHGARLVEITPADALAWLGWAGATGAAHGRRRGSAAGRFGVWWLLAALGDIADDWPVDPDELGAIAGALRWYWWDAGEPGLGWEVQLAIGDPAEGYAWAISAHDAD